jgi:flavocytochrome c
MKKPENTKLIERRKFLSSILTSGAATVAGGLVVAGCVSEDGKDGKDGMDAETVQNMNWDQEIDVVVVGAGGAGLVASIETANAGAAVILLEKSDKVGGNTSYSDGILQASGTTFQQNFGVTNDTPDKHNDYWIQAGEGSVDEDLVRLMADNSGPDIEWLGQLGVEYIAMKAIDPIPYIDPGLLLRRLHQADGNGATYADVLSQKAQKLGVDIRTDSPATTLITDLDGRVIGLTAQVQGSVINIRARKAVILTSGGFDRNLEMAKAYSPQLFWDLQNNMSMATSANEGDGIKMGMAIGADMAGTGATISYPALHIGRGDYDPPIPGIWVNKYGQRFVNEGVHYGYASRAIFDQEEHIAWALFDETVKEMGGSTIGGWSEDLSQEIASGKITTADTLADLATAIGVNAGQLDLTLQKWNADMASSEDTLFGKLVGLQALDTPPYYASRVLAYNVGSCGGLRIDSDARVLNAAGEFIAGLYAAGMVSGGFIGPYYPGSGTAITATVVFGRIAGRNAAAEKA